MFCEISIIILTKNAAKDIEKCLSGVFSQKTKYTYEVIIIDSGSGDDTINLAKKFPVNIINIKPEEFGHGRTRNLGAKLAKGEYLIYLVQDAYPVNEYWLESLVKNMADEKVAGVYGRWLPKENCNPIEACSTYELFPLFKCIGNLDSISEYCKETYSWFSNVSSCIKKRVLEEFPFDDDIIFAEDKEWFIRAIKAGFIIIYEPDSVVYHSHNYSLIYNLKRAFDLGISSKKWGQLDLKFKVSFLNLLFMFFDHTYQDYLFMKKNKIFFKIKWISYGVIWRLTRLMAQWMGAHYNCLPKRLIKKFSTVPHMFD